MKKRIIFLGILLSVIMVLVALDFSPTAALQAQTQRACWCCIDGKVIQMSPAECKRKGGRCFSTKEECQGPNGNWVRFEPGLDVIVQ